MKKDKVRHSDKVATLYNDNYKNNQEPNFFRGRDYAVKTLTYLPHPKGKKALDVGCGDGSAVVVFANAGMMIVGIDLSIEGIKKAKREVKGNNNLELIVGDIL